MRSYFATLYSGVADVPEDAPGRRNRTSYLAEMSTHSTWLARLEAGQQSTEVAAHEARAVG